MSIVANEAALVLFSGGQDSTTCLAWALQRFEYVETIGFDYGQRHRVELECRLAVLKRLRVEFVQWSAKLADDHLLALPVLEQISETALTRDVALAIAGSGLPNTFVPGRNLLFLTLAAAVAYRRNVGVLVGGMCETDFSGYPDCRATTMQAMQQALSLGLGRAVKVETPLMHLTKAGTWRLAHELGGRALTNVIIEDSHTCYLGNRDTWHSWGVGCGACPACTLRARGYSEWLATP